MSISTDIVSFLKRTPEIVKLNFAFGKLKVYPSGYQSDVANAIDSGDIKVRLGSAAVPDHAAAAYFAGFDTLDLRAGFTISDVGDQAYLVHECTHALLDLQAIGAHSGHDDEAAAYIAEALYLEALGQPPLTPHAIRGAAHDAAKKVLAGTYALSSADMLSVTRWIAASPEYQNKSSYDSNGTDRPFYKSMLRIR